MTRTGLRRRLLFGVLTAFIAGVPADARQMWDLLDRLAWLPEHDPASRVTFVEKTVSPGPGLSFSYALGDGRPSRQLAAIARAWPAVPTSGSHIVISGRADRPVRVMVMLRGRGVPSPPVWRASVYLDGHLRQARIAVRDFERTRPADGDQGLRDIEAVLVGLDTQHSRPGAAGIVVLERLQVEW